MITVTHVGNHLTISKAPALAKPVSYRVCGEVSFPCHLLYRDGADPEKDCCFFRRYKWLIVFCSVHGTTPFQLVLTLRALRPEDGPANVSCLHGLGRCGWPCCVKHRDSSAARVPICRWCKSGHRSVHVRQRHTPCGYSPSEGFLRCRRGSVHGRRSGLGCCGW